MLSIQPSVLYSLNCVYIRNKDDRHMRLVHRQMLFELYDDLYAWFDTEYE